MIVDQAEQLSRLIGDIYDAALDSSLWSEVVGRAGRFVGGAAAAIFSKSPIAGNGEVLYEFGTDLYYRHLYFEKYVKLDPATAGHYFADIGDPIAVEDIMPYREFLETRFYKEWAKPQGIVDFISAVLDKSVTSAALFGVFRYERDGIVDDEVRRRMCLIVPHIRRAVHVGRVIELGSAQVATFADVLDRLSTGLCFVDATGRILHTNTACQAILGADDFLSADGGRLVASDARVDASLQGQFAATAGNVTSVDSPRTSLPVRALDGTHYVMHILPLTSGARRLAATAYPATAALLVHKAATEVPSSPEILSRAYNLTPTELRVLLAIVEVGGVPEVAAALGVGEATVKTHLGRLFVKTGAGRQADLVKIVAGFSTPLIG